MEIKGIIDHITFYNDENGFVVARLLLENKQTVQITGSLPAIKVGEVVELEGNYQQHKKHGTQFVIDHFKVLLPEDVMAIQKYLESGLIKGIGKELAKRIVKVFKEKTLEVIDNTPHRLSEIEGIGTKRIEQIIYYWQEQKAIRHVMLFLAKYSISQTFAQKIYRTYGDKTIEVLQNNPYVLAQDIQQVGFLKADEIASKLGIERASETRLKAGLMFILTEKMNQGHTCYPKTLLLEETKEKLAQPVDLIENSLKKLLLEKHLIEKGELIFPKSTFYAEKSIFEKIDALLTTKTRLRDFDAKKALDWAEENAFIQFAKNQKQACLAAFLEKMLIITGGPGTGKTTILNAILKVFDKLTKHILLAAPTGKAAKRLKFMTKKHAKTIHGLLEWDFSKRGFKKNEDNPLLCDVLIIDESSMLDTFLLNSLLKALRNTTKVIFVGDIDQLPSVGCGNVLKDMIYSEKIPCIRLDTIFRQAKRSLIVTNAHKVNSGIFPYLAKEEKGDFFFIEEEDLEKTQQTIVELLSRIEKKYGFSIKQDIQVLSPMKKGQIGTFALNEVMQSNFSKNQPFLNFGNRRFYEQDKVIQMRNNYDLGVFNGEVGIIEKVHGPICELEVNFDGKKVLYEPKDMIDLELGYCVSIHKYQGSESPCIIMPVSMSHFMLLNRNLIYTGMTRAKKLLVMIGTKKALAIAIQNDEVKQRYTGLLELLKGRQEELLLN